MLQKLAFPALVFGLLFPQFLRAEIKMQTVEYTSGDTVCEGVLVLDDAQKTARPGVLLVPDWMGVSDYAKSRAKQLAELGYVAFVADIYGKGVRPANPAEAGAQAGKYKSDRPTLRARVNSALAELKKNSLVEKGQTAAIGYCFGGTTALELARSGADVTGVVTFHGGLDSPTPADGKNIKAKVLVLHGADDPTIKPPDLAAFQEELRSANVDWQMISYSGAVHSFSNPGAGNDKAKGNAYNAAADKRSWQAMKTFFAELFPKS